MTRLRSRSDVMALFDATIPILQAGMGGVAQPELAAAVCESGAFGMIGLYRHTNDEIAQLLDETVARTSKRFGVNFVPFVLDDSQLIERLAYLDTAPVDPVVTFFGLPGKAVLKRAAATDFGVQVGSFDEIEMVFDAGAKFCILQTSEAGGHHLGQCSREQAIAQATKLRVHQRMIFLSGGVSQAREIRTILDAGFAGVLCGTIFAATAESAAHDAYKRAIVDSQPADTIITDRFRIGWHTHSHRVIRNRTCDGQLDSTIIGSASYFGKRYPIPRYSVAVPTRGTEGEIADMALYCGTSCKDIHAIRTVEQVLRDLTE